MVTFTCSVWLYEVCLCEVFFQVYMLRMVVLSVWLYLHATYGCMSVLLHVYLHAACGCIESVYGYILYGYMCLYDTRVMRPSIIFHYSSN